MARPFSELRDKMSARALAEPTHAPDCLRQRALGLTPVPHQP